MKLEEYLDTEYRLLGLHLRIRHFLPEPYVHNTAKHGISAVTIVSPTPINEEAVIHALDLSELRSYLSDSTLTEKQAEIIKHLRKDFGHYGIAVTTTPKPKRLRRIIAKGRLLKYIRLMQEDHRQELCDNHTKKQRHDPYNPHPEETP